MLYLSLILFSLPINAVVKVFINNSNKHFFVHIHNEKSHITGLCLDPGAVQDVFLPDTSIIKIMIQDEKHKDHPLSSMAHHVLKRDIFPINEKMIFIIQQDASVKMFKGSTSRDAMLQKLDTAYTTKSSLPTVDLSIHAIQTDQLWLKQTIKYDLTQNKSFLGSIGSIFQ